MNTHTDLMPSNRDEKVRLTIDLKRWQRNSIATVADALGMSSSQLVRILARNAVREYTETGTIGNAEQVAYKRGVAEERERWLAFVAQAQAAAAAPVERLEAVDQWRTEAFADRSL